MTRYLARRLLETIVVVFLSLTAVFLMLHLTGDPVKLFLPTDALPAQIAEVRHRLGFDQPIWLQYLRFVAGAARGDFGESLRYGVPALKLLLERFPATLELTGWAMLVSLLTAIPVGVISAARRNSLTDYVGIIITVTGQAVPGFWLGIMGIILFSVRLGWFPTGGRGTWEQLVLPTLTLAAYTAARFARITRSTMLDVLSQDYVRTGRAKGLAERYVLYKHALKNALIPILTLVGLQLGQLLGGAVVTETVFSWPGVGRLLVQALLNRDFPLVLAGVFWVSLLISLTNLLVDLAYAWVNPQIHYG
ncbi:MAG: ABC transporter permease [Firmicutes bacterium]|nr:ABC transporter permease [Bacillota bacterium]MCL5040063.1 ABC transporter permease [Bacillota bacterium]